MPNEEAVTRENLEKISSHAGTIMSELSKRIIGQNEIIKKLLITLFSGGHCLIEGVPGLAKTLLIKSLSEVLELHFSRVQFTPDLMPSDITGTDILEDSSAQKSFRFIKGPIFTNLLLADEINRTPPKTQAALLQAMQEFAVTAGGTTYPLDPPFFVMATQNPLEQEGTYPLPEAQLDRFMFRIFMDYPSSEEEEQITRLTTGASGAPLKPAISKTELIKIPEILRAIPVSDHVIQYAVKLVRKSRPQNKDCPEFVKEWVSWGGGPRAPQYLILGAKANALLRGSINVATLDVRAVADAVLNHRIITNFNAEAEGIDSRAVIKKLIDFVQE